MSLLDSSSLVVFPLDNSMEVSPLALLLASMFLFLEELLPTLQWAGPCFWIFDGLCSFSDYCHPALLVVRPCCKWFWISERLCSSIVLHSNFSAWALINLSLSSFILLTVSTKFGGVSLALLPLYSSSRNCEASSILLFLSSFLVSPTCWNNKPLLVNHTANHMQKYSWPYQGFSVL